MTSKYYDSTIMHSVKDLGANIEDGGLSKLSEQEKKFPQLCSKNQGINW